jgi:hypothetical protein
MNGTNQFAGVETMTNVERQSSTQSISGSGLLLVGSALMILVGIVFQAGELGFGHLRVGNLWLFSVVASDLWNLLSTHLGGPTVSEVLRFWPLILVGLGMAIVLATQEKRFSRRSSGGRNAR